MPMSFHAGIISVACEYDSHNYHTLELVKRPENERPDRESAQLEYPTASPVLSDRNG